MRRLLDEKSSEIRHFVLLDSSRRIPRGPWDFPSGVYQLFFFLKSAFGRVPRLLM